MILLPVIWLAAAPASGEPLKDKIDREFVQPALSQVQGALSGRQPNWTPPVLPGTATTARLSEKVRARWLDPLLGGGQTFALSAARSLASPRTFEAPAEPDLAGLLPDASLSPETERMVSDVERRFLSRLFPEEYALRAASALGSGRADEAAPQAPDQSDLERLPAEAGPPPGVPGAGLRFARAGDFQAKRKFADSTRLTRGSAGGSSAPRLKPTRSRFSSRP